MRIFVCLGCYFFFTFSLLAQGNNIINRGSISLLYGNAKEKAEYQGSIASGSNYGVACDIGIIKKHPNLKIALAFINTEAEIEDGDESLEAGTFSRNKEINKIQEIDLGLLYIFNKNPIAALRFYVGGGVTNISVKQNADGMVQTLPTELSGSGSGDGYFFNTGIKYILKKSFNIGLDLRDSSSNFKLTGESTTRVPVGEVLGDYESPEKNFGFTRLMFALYYNF